MLTVCCTLFLYNYVTSQDLHSFPTRRSSDLLPGQGTSYNITVAPTGGFTGSVTLSVSGLPTGAGGTFAPNPTTGSSTLSVTTDRKSTRLNSSHRCNSYAVFCLKKKRKYQITLRIRTPVLHPAIGRGCPR